MGSQTDPEQCLKRIDEEEWRRREAHFHAHIRGRGWPELERCAGHQLESLRHCKRQKLAMPCTNGHVLCETCKTSLKPRIYPTCREEVTLKATDMEAFLRNGGSWPQHGPMPSPGLGKPTYFKLYVNGPTMSCAYQCRSQLAGIYHTLIRSITVCLE